MRVIEPTELHKHSGKRKRAYKLRVFLGLTAVLILIGGVYTAMAYNRALPSTAPQLMVATTLPAQPVGLPWPAYGQSAVGAQGYGVLASSHDGLAVPIASVAKVLVATAVLRQKPIVSGQQGPLITITAQDVEVFEQAAAEGGSVVTVVEGEQISEYQALQALLLPSGNNMADTLANWAFGSTDAYLAYANNLAKGIGMAGTRIADASGFLPQSVSTASDLVKLGEAAMQNPVLAEIVAQQQAEIPEAGVVYNVNFLLGQDGIIGIKTGNTNAAGGCFLFAAVREVVPGQRVTVVGAILGAPSLNVAMRDAVPLLNAAYQGFGQITVVKAGQTVANYSLPWGTRTTAIAQKSLTIFGWRGLSYKPNFGLLPLQSPQAAGYKVGTVGVDSIAGRKTVPVVLGGSTSSPSTRWRLFRK